jgi:GDP-mannose 6-dehydrogenase
VKGVALRFRSMDSFAVNVSLFGLGYVGSVTAACLSKQGHRVIGVDVQVAKVESLQRGEAPILEPGLDELLAEGVQTGRLSATTDAALAVRETELSVLCVGTPGLESGRQNLNFVRAVTQQVAAALKEKRTLHTVIYRSTLLPGTTKALVAEFFADMPWVTVGYAPEFLREGSAVSDFLEPSLAVMGGLVSPTVRDMLAPGGRIVSWETAEMVKYACNAYHALKVSFANEMGRLAKHLDLDGAEVMKVVCDDTRLNVSRAYLKPGNPFGGSCLPKDVAALASLARVEGVSLPLLDGALLSNQAHLDALIRCVVSTGKRRVGLLGLSFKAETDDLRGSPMVALAETLLGRGYELHIYDPQLNLSSLIGANRAEIERRIPHLAAMLRRDAGEVLQRSDVIVASQCCASLEELTLHVRPDHSAIDINGWPDLQTLPWSYQGLCW